MQADLNYTTRDIDITNCFFEHKSFGYAAKAFGLSESNVFRIIKNVLAKAMQFVDGSHIQHHTARKDILNNFGSLRSLWVNFKNDCHHHVELSTLNLKGHSVRVLAKNNIHTIGNLISLTPCQLSQHLDNKKHSINEFSLLCEFLQVELAGVPIKTKAVNPVDNIVAFKPVEDSPVATVNCHINQLKLSVNLTMTLTLVGVVSINDFKQLTKIELLSLEDVTPQYANELEETLFNMGVRLKSSKSLITLKQLSAIQNHSISELDLPQHLLFQLYINGFETVESIVNTSKTELVNIRTIGHGNIGTINKAIQKHKLALNKRAA